MNKKIIALTAILIGMIGWAGDSAPFLLDTTDPLITAPFTYNSSWIGGDSSAEVVIVADGMEIRRTTGEGEFVWSPTTAGKYILTYTTYINGVAQDEVYTATVYADWKYAVGDGKATIVETTQKSGNVTIPPEIDGFPVVGIERDVFAGCHDLFITVPPSFTNVVSTVKSFSENEWARDDSESGEVYKSNDIDHNGSTYMIATVKGPFEFFFDWKVSSESGFDWLRWYLDGSRKAEISGEKSWQTVTYSLPEGEHTIKWEYSKDGSVDKCSDCGWVRINENMTKMDFGDAIAVCIDYPFATGGDASWRNDEGLLLRSGAITNNLSSWLEMTVPGPGKLTYKWKSSSEYYEDESEEIYEIYDYGYLSVDNEAMGGLSDDDYALEGVAIGGHTDWQDEEFDVTGEGEHTLRWTYVKDEYDDGQMIGEDCIWVDQIKFRPYATLSFDLGGGVGETPNAIYELHETLITLPSDAGFSRDNHVFDGWCDGNRKYAAGETYEMPKTNAVLTAMWIAKRFHSFDLNGGVGEVPAVIKDIPGTKITLPNANGFHRDYYTFAGWNDGSETYAANATYTVVSEGVEFTAVWEANTIETPVISSSSVADGGILDAASGTITITCDAGATVYYTLDGSTPTVSSEKYTGAFEVFDLGEVEIKAVALRDNYFASSVATFTYTRKAYTLAECLNAGSRSVSSVAPAWFRVQGDAAHDGNEAIRSGAIGANESSTVEMTVYGEGTISFWWKVSSHDPRGRKYDHVAFFVGDEEVTWISGEQDWANVTYSITGKGTHALKWVYKKNGDTSVAGNDCAWLDEVVWMGKFDITYENLKGATHQNPSFYCEGMNIEFTKPSAVNGYTFTGWTPSEILASDIGDKVITANWEWKPQDAVVDASITGLKPVTVKADWVKTELEQKFGAGKKESFISKFGADLTSAMTKKTGKKDVVGNELLVWHDYVAGTDPTDINSTFKAIIDIEDGKPVIRWEPDLNSEGEERVYTVYGKEMLSDIWHSPITALDHFFKVDVAMPCEGTVTFNVGGGSSVSPVSIRVGQPIGELPTPTRDGYTFLGWFTASEGGNAVTSETLVAADMTLYAKWTIKSYTVVFDANGGNGGVSKSYTHCAALGELPTPTRDGYMFLGWFTSASGGTQVAASTVVTGSNTLYAQWEEITSLTLSGALDIEGSGVTVGGNVEWFGQTDISYDAVDSAQSGDISDNQTSWMEVVVKDVSSISFWWKVSSESNYDKLHFYVDGTEVVDPISGQRDWIKVEYKLAAGSHTLKWSYTKDGSVSNGDDCGWVDSVVLSQSQPQTHEKVQLWKNGPYWATTNIGAENPEDSGYYFWWGDTVGYKREGNKWVASDGSNSNFSFRESNTPTDNKSVATLQSEGWITSDNVLASEYDAAQAHWGGDWRMPTKQEFDELGDKCDWTWTTMNGVNGYVVRGRGDYASASIFLPSAGSGSWTSLYNAGSAGYFLSSVPLSDYNMWNLNFDSGSHGVYSGGRDQGLSVRPLQGFTK